MALSTSERLACTLVERRRSTVPPTARVTRQVPPVTMRRLEFSPRRIAALVLVALPMLLAAAIMLGFA